MDNDEQKKPTPRLARGVVARGRTVVVPTAQTRTAGYTAEGKPIVVPVTKTFVPGQEIELPHDEIKWLRSIGHLIDPNAPMPPPAQGATLTELGELKSA